MQTAREELNKLRTRHITESRLKKAKRQLLGQLAISRENNEHYMLSAGKSYLVFNRVDSLETIGRNLEGITASQLRDTANLVLDPKSLNLLIFES